MSLLLELSITPLDKGKSVSKYVARSIDIIDKSGINYQLGPMGTCLEGEWDEVFKVVKQCFQEMKKDCARVTLAMKADYRSDKSGTLQSKVESVEKQLGRKIKK